MQIKQFIEEANRTNAPLESSQLTDIHMLMGMVTEVGELMDVYKKNLAYTKPMDLVNVQEEIGDLMWYVAGFCKNNNFDLERILDVCIEKLKARYPEKFSRDSAINRNLSRERSILEQMRDSSGI